MQSRIQVFCLRIQLAKVRVIPELNRQLGVSSFFPLRPLFVRESTWRRGHFVKGNVARLLHLRKFGVRGHKKHPLSRATEPGPLQDAGKCAILGRSRYFFPGARSSLTTAPFLCQNMGLPSDGLPGGSPAREGPLPAQKIRQPPTGSPSQFAPRRKTPQLFPVINRSALDAISGQNFAQGQKTLVNHAIFIHCHLETSLKRSKNVKHQPTRFMQESSRRAETAVTAPRNRPKITGHATSAGTATPPRGL